MRSFRSPKNNPSTTSESISESQSQTSSNNDSSSGAIPVNLTTQRLQDWKAFLPNGAPAVAGGEVQNSSPVGVGKQLVVGAPSPKSNSSRGVTNLILLIEQGQWNAASQRAISHPHEVRQLVKLRKTTKNAPPPPSTSPTAATSAGGSVQISNVKCKALHHACQKLRSVHTTIYQKKMTPTPPSNTTYEGGHQRKSLIEEDEYIEACKCILTLIRLHPEACKERESRHGCLPLHLCVFSMCATPPPPSAAAVPPPKGGKKQPTSTTPTSSVTKSFSDLLFGTSSSSTRPPPISNRATSSPNPNTPHHHHSHTRDSSADFSVGNISTMIQEESEHQKKLDEHHRKNKSNNTTEVDNNNFETSMNQKLDSMEQILHGFEQESDKRTKKSLLKKKVGLGSSLGSALGTMVVGALTPLDSLEEKSRETDSYSTPLNANARGRQEGMEANSTLHPLMRPPSTLSSLRQYVSPSDNNEGSFDKSDDGSSTRSGGTAASSGSSSNANGDSAAAAVAAAAAAPPTHEELQRRYLQINTRRRDEFSIRVIDALLDAWPRGPKTASEGGRLPLHMACFGKATQRVLETVLRAYPDAARQRNADGFLPIHIAAHWGVSHPDVAPLLLRAYPDGAVGRNRWERTPIEEALGMAGENGREHQMSLVWSLRRHPTYWIHNDIAMMLLPRNVRNAPWRIADMGKGNVTSSSTARRIGGRNGSSAVDVDEVGSSDEEDEGIEVQMPNSPKNQNPKQIKALAEATDLSLLIARDKHWEAAALRCRLCPNEAGEALEVKVRGAYTAKITPLLFACEHSPSVELIKALIKANPASLKRRQDPGGQLPIHAACTWAASSGVIDTLLSTDSSMAEEQDFLSNLPLHCACYSGADTSIIRALLRVYPQSVWTRNHQGSSAVDIVKRLSHPNRREVLGLLDMTMKNLLEKKKKETKKAEEGVEVDKDNSLMWV
eukprot:scaffold1017_cov95-Skeletonema_dohrnii-CCMP3373.AAC.3